MKDDNCIFCKIAAGKIPSNTLYENDSFRVILDIAPAAKGHAIVLPKAHMADLFAMDADIAATALPVITKVAGALKEALSCDGINLMQNNGKAAGQTIFHLHFHIIPRFHDDGLTIPGQTTTYDEGEAEALAAKVRSLLMHQPSQQ